MRNPPKTAEQPLSLTGVMDAAADLDDFLQVLVNGRRTLVEGGWSAEVAEQLMVMLVAQSGAQ